MKRLLLFLLLLASIGCKKELAPHGEQKMELTDFITTGCNCEITTARFRLDAEGSIWLISTDTAQDINTPNLLDLEYNPTNNVGSTDGNRTYYDRTKFANWPPKNYKYFRQ